MTDFKNKYYYVDDSPKLDKLEQTMYGNISLFDEKSFLDEIINKDTNSVTQNIIEEAYKIPAFIDFLDKLKVNNPKLVADISENTQKLINEGKLTLKITSNGNYSAILRDGNKFAEQITLKKEYFSPSIAVSLNNISMQNQLGEIIKNLEDIKQQVDRVLEGQQDDRIALCESAIQQMLYSTQIDDLNFKQLCISNALKTASDGKMQILLSVIKNIQYIKSAQVGFMGESQKDIDLRMVDLSKNLSVYIKASCIESMLFLSISEQKSALLPLKNCLYSLEKYLDEEICLKLNSNIGNDIIKNHNFKQNYWVDMFPKNVEKIAEKLEYLNTKRLEFNKKIIDNE